MVIKQQAASRPDTEHSTSESSDHEWGMDRRTYLKGAAAVGLTAGLAGCININERFESSVVGLDPQWATSAAYVSADHRPTNSTYNNSGAYGSINVTAVSHAVTYEKEQTASGLTPAIGVLTTPIPTFAGQSVEGWNPFVGTSIQDLVEGENAKPLLEGLGIDIGGNVNWEAGPTHEVLDPEGMTLMGSPVENYVLTHGVLRTGSTLRAVVLLIARVKQTDPKEVLVMGSSVERIVAEGVGSESLREEYAQPMQEAFSSPSGNLQIIDPESDLAMFS